MISRRHPAVPPAPLEETDLVGGRFRVVRELGRGGFARVYEAVEERFGRRVALKLLHEDAFDDREAARALLEEARLLAFVQHPNVIGVHEVLWDERGPVVVLELALGWSVRALTFEDATPCPVGERVVRAIGVQAASGLAAIHAAGRNFGASLSPVHRDVSPANLQVTRGGTVKVLDLGVAWSDALPGRAQTVPGIVKGTLPYVAPEYVLGRGLDARADVFSLGVVLWELLAGARLFKRSCDVDTVVALSVCAVPELRKLRPDVSPRLCALVHAMLERDRGARPQSMKSVVAELARASIGDDATPEMILESWANARGSRSVTLEASETMTLTKRR